MGLLNQTQQEYYQGNDFGNYQFTSLDDIINQFMIVYVGEDKIIPKIKRTDVAFHAQRAIQELSFDTFKSFKAQEITVPASLQMKLPHDYVNYTKISWVDSAGVKHLLYPTSKTSNPVNPYQNSDGNFILQAVGTFIQTNSIALDKEYKNIQVGMIVTGFNIPLTGANNGPVVVESTSNSSGITTITIADTDGTSVIPSATVGTVAGANTLTFTMPQDSSLILEEQSSVIVENVTFGVSMGNLISTEDGSGSPIKPPTTVKIGMLVSHTAFPSGTTVVDIDNMDYNIIVSNAATVDATATTNEITFISPDSQSNTWSNYKSGESNQTNHDAHHHHHHDDHEMLNKRYGLDPQHAQANGSFYIDNNTGKIHFSSNISGKTVILDYISDGLAGSGEVHDANCVEVIPVHKFAEEAMYKWISHAVLASKANTPEYLVARYKKERFAAVRTAKLRLSNIKLEEITQILRGKSKQIKH